MRLKCIKLVGFKSFVDATTVSFPGNLSAVVGPNGCGKSNIIDAVRWVMGESSAKHLRGESMMDVIFNGSNARKPVSQASIELVFDNSEGKLVGEYAKYNEISVKRLVTREGQSVYFLNGTKCRRKDITDLFLGTGLGPRSYAIIEQGMISRLIEAKPEELRVYIEEAAGISKYKERRKETESRMRRTRENLERLDDLREELGRQLERLQKQAANAEKYKNFKAEERLKKAQLQAMRWQQMNSDASGQTNIIRELELSVEAGVTEQNKLDTQLEAQRLQHAEVNDQFNEAQSHYYGVGADIARLEQTIQHQKERDQQLKTDLEELERAWQSAQSHLRDDKDALETLSATVLELEPEQEIADSAEEQAVEALAAAEDVMSEWQHQWDRFNETSGDSQRQAQVQQSNIQHREQSVARSQERLLRLRDERDQLAAQGGEDELDALNERLMMAEEALAERQEELERLADEMTQRRQQNLELSQRLDVDKTQQQTLLGRQSSLEALQQAALGQSERVANWLETHDLGDRKTLAEQLVVRDGWDLAVETVLEKHLQAVCVERLDSLTGVIAELEQGEVTLIDEQGTASALSEAPNPQLGQRLLSFVEQGADQAGALLSKIYAAEDLDAALAMRVHLNPGESVMTRDGLWVGANWCRVKRADDAQGSVLERRKQLEAVTAELEEKAQSVEALSEQLTDGRERLLELEAEREDVQRSVSDSNRELGDIKAQLGAKQARLEQLRARRERIESEISEADLHIREENEAIGEARMVLQEALDDMEEHNLKREELNEQRESNRERVSSARDRLRTEKEKSHQLAMDLKSTKTQLAAVQQGLQRAEAQVQTLSERRTTLMEAMAQGDAPIDELQGQLEEHLERRLAAEERLAIVRRELETIEHAMREMEQQRTACEHQLQQVRSNLEQKRLQTQSVKVQLDNLLERIQEEDFELETLLKELPEGANESEWNEEIERLAVRISRLGAINLAAIDEYEQESERKTYLDEQHEDLTKALDLLEGAIRKIDKETRARFKETFDKVNKGLQELFPKVFGGGHAYLELTGDDLLDTGVAIMARPPGKKNSTIHLLSGGEKALTAIALVFSIFRLNPAPFCMLDEVDAPLDDANVGRFCRMVEEMAETVQFIYISHNKIAMEMAQQLMGVTMHEPGCSRLVTVDVDEAAAMAAL